MENVADQHKLRKYIMVSHKVIGAQWIESQQKWQIKVVRTDGRELMTGSSESRKGEVGVPWVEECDIFLNATGCFNDWKWPSIPGRETFKGEMVHSAQWPRNLSLQGKTVALIGNGSTGVQILPAILDEVDKVYVFVRSKTWITAGFAQVRIGRGNDKAWRKSSDTQIRSMPGPGAQIYSFRKSNSVTGKSTQRNILHIEKPWSLKLIAASDFI